MSNDKAPADVKSWKRPREVGSTASYDTAEAQGRVHRIELEQLIIHKTDARAAWLDGADRVARAVLNRELREDEDFRRTGPGSYRIRLPQLTPEAGELWCSVLSEMVAREVRRLDPVLVELDRDRSRADLQRPEAGTRPRRPAPSSLKPANSSQTPAENQETMRRDASRAFERMGSSPAPSEGAGLTPADRSALDEVSLNFHPVWHAKNRMITAYHCRPSRDGHDLTAPQLRGLLSPMAPDLLDAKIDALVYEEAMKVVQWLIIQRLTALLILPIHFSTIDKQRLLSAVLGVAATLPSQTSNLVVFEIVDMPADITRLRLRDRITNLRGRARGLVARLDFERHDLKMFKENGFHGVSVNLDEAGYDDANLIKTLEQFVVAAENHGLKSFVQAIASNSQNVAALSAGFTYIDGPIISPPSSHPSHIRPFDIDMLYGV